MVHQLMGVSEGQVRCVPHLKLSESADSSTGCSQTSTDSDLVSTPRTYCRSYLQKLLGSAVAEKIMELRKLLVDGADSRPIEALDELCRFVNI
jgi:hypothetical protein